MNVLDVLDMKIKALKETLNQVRSSNLSEKQILEAELIVIQECENVLNSEELISSYDFTSTVSLLHNQNLIIENIEKILQEIKQVIDVRKTIMPELPYSSVQKITLEQLKENIKIAKEKLLLKIEEFSKKTESNEKIENLEELKNIKI